MLLRELAAAIGLLLAGCLADTSLGLPLGLPLVGLGVVILGARRYGTTAGLTLSIATAMLGLSLHVTANGQPLAEEAWQAFVVAVLLGATGYFVARLGKVEQRLLAIAATDPLTGIYNRRALTEAASIEISRQSRSGSPLSVVHIDLDNFKRVNDTYGHSEGDKVLCAVAQVLRGGRVTDVAARFGGDEFVLLLPDTSPQAARVMVDRLRTRLAGAMQNGRWNGVTVSMGIATFMQPAESAEELIHSADLTMYDVKRANKDGVRQVVIDGEHTTTLLHPPLQAGSKLKSVGAST